MAQFPSIKRGQCPLVHPKWPLVHSKSPWTRGHFFPQSGPWSSASYFHPCYLPHVLTQVSKENTQISFTKASNKIRSPNISIPLHILKEILPSCFFKSTLNSDLTLHQSQVKGQFSTTNHSLNTLGQVWTLDNYKIIPNMIAVFWQVLGQENNEIYKNDFINIRSCVWHSTGSTCVNISQYLFLLLANFYSISSGSDLKKPVNLVKINDLQSGPKVLEYSGVFISDFPAPHFQCWSTPYWYELHYEAQHWGRGVVVKGIPFWDKGLR